MDYVEVLRHQRKLFNHFPLDLVLVIFDFKASPYLGGTATMSNEGSRVRANASYFNATFHWRDSEVDCWLWLHLSHFNYEDETMKRYYLDAVTTCKDHTAWAANFILRRMYKRDFVNQLLKRKTRIAFRFDGAPTNICGTTNVFIRRIFFMQLLRGGDLWSHDCLSATVPELSHGLALGADSATRTLY